LDLFWTLFDPFWGHFGVILDLFGHTDPLSRGVRVGHFWPLKSATIGKSWKSAEFASSRGVRVTRFLVILAPFSGTFGGLSCKNAKTPFGEGYPRLSARGNAACLPANPDPHEQGSPSLGVVIRDGYRMETPKTGKYAQIEDIFSDIDDFRGSAEFPSSGSKNRVPRPSRGSFRGHLDPF